MTSDKRNRTNEPRRRRLDFAYTNEELLKGKNRGLKEFDENIQD